MLKISWFIIISIFYGAGISINMLSVAMAQSVTASNIDEPVCYMQTVDGEILNLSSMCNSSPDPQPQVVITESFQEDGYLIGRVVNRTDRNVRNVQVNYEVRDSSGKVLERSSTSIEPQDLPPGQTAMFEAFATAEGQVRATSVNWNE